MSLTRRLAEFTVTAKAADLPALDRDILRRHALDAAIARVLGGQTEEGRRLREVFGPGLGAEGIAGIAGLVRMTEMDDIHTASNTTPSSVAAPVAFCLWPESGRAPDEIESAIYVGVEVMVRFGRAMDGARALFKGFWPTRCGATLAACAVACRMLGLGVDETEQALSLAITTGASRSGRFAREPSGRWIVFANAVASGMRMATAARAGFQGATPPPDADWIATTLALPFDGALLLDGLGGASVFPELSLKPYATARQSLGVTEAMRALIAEGLDPASVRRVVLRAPTSHQAMIGQPLDRHARGAAFVSAAAQVATAALSADDLYDVERRNVLADPRFADFASRIEVVGDPEHDREFPAIWSASIEVETGTGVLRKEVRHALGSPENRMDDAALAEKAGKALAWFGQQPRAAQILAAGAGMFADAASAKAVADVFTAG